MSAHTPNYRIVWHIGTLNKGISYTSPFRATRQEAMKRVYRQRQVIAGYFGVKPTEIPWELEYRKEGIDRWEIVETSQRNAIAHHDNATG